MKRVSGRLTILHSSVFGLSGITEIQVGTDQVELFGEAIEAMMDINLEMLYVMPLRLTSPATKNYLGSVAEQYIVADLIDCFFTRQTDSVENSDNFAVVNRKMAADNFQRIFGGTGIFIPGSDPALYTIQNDPKGLQMQHKAIILPEEILKPYIGYDTNGDGSSDTDIFQKNPSDPTFVVSGSVINVGDDSAYIQDNIQLRPTLYQHPSTVRRNRETVNFW